MRRIYFSKLLIAITLIALSFLSSCTIVGIATGSKIAKERRLRRPVRQPESTVFDTLTVSTWLDVVTKDEKTKEGKFVGIDKTGNDNNGYNPLLVIDVKGQRKHSAIPINDINHIVIGRKSDGPKLLGGAIGLVLDSAFSFWVITEIIKSLGVGP
jgi:hypothetical protein